MVHLDCLYELTQLFRNPTGNAPTGICLNYPWFKITTQGFIQMKTNFSENQFPHFGNISNFLESIKHVTFLLCSNYKVCGFNKHLKVCILNLLEDHYSR